MGDYDNIDWKKHNYRRVFAPKKREPNIDKTVSDIVGKKILANDPRLAKLAIKWRGNKPLDGKEAPDNHLKDPKKVAELKKVLRY